MNNLESLCIDFITDTLNNRPRNINGQEEKYNNSDRESLLKIITEQKEVAERYKDSISSDSYLLLVKLYDGLYEILNKKLV